MWSEDVFEFLRDHVVDVSHDFVGGVLSSQVTNLLSLEFIGLMDVETMAFVISVSIPISMLRFTNTVYSKP